MPCRPPSFRASARILCGKSRKRPYDKEQAIPLLSANKNCQLTDDRILLTEKTFTLIRQWGLDIPKEQEKVQGKPTGKKKRERER